MQKHCKLVKTMSSINSQHSQPLVADTTSEVYSSGDTFSENWHISQGVERTHIKIIHF